jgi:cytochrome c oxidase subunit 2
MAYVKGVAEALEGAHGSKETPEPLAVPVPRHLRSVCVKGLMPHLRLTVGLLLGATVTEAAAKPAEEPLRFNMVRGVTDTSHHIYDLHMTVLVVVTVIALGVFSVMIYSIIRHRNSRGAQASQFRGNLAIEIIWTAIPLLLLLTIAIPATRTLLAIASHPPAELTVEIRGSQWKWHYAYRGMDYGFYSNLKSNSESASRLGSKSSPNTVAYYLRDVDKPLVLPVGERIRLLITSDDVIHSWWVPAFGIKRDAIPGYINRVHFTIDKPGAYRGQCAELCGVGHGFMPIVVKAVSRKDFQSWIKQAKQEAAQQKKASGQAPWTMSRALKEGKQTFDSICAACHKNDGEGQPGMFPALKGSPIATGPLKGHLDIVIHGSKKNPLMRPWGKQMNDRKLAGVITYERNAWGNNTGDLVKPEQVEAAR